MFKNKTLLITGGTGSFGNAVLGKFLDSNIKEIRVFSRDEKKQDDMRRLYRSKKIKYFVGTENVLNASIINQVEKVICLSTDKAVYPINAMGVSKAMMEKVFVAKSRITNHTKIIGTRYGNVMASRGSVIPLFHSQIINNNEITITDPTMTRFMMTLNNAVDLVTFAFKNGNSGDIFVQKSPSSTIGDLAKVLKKIYNSNVNIKNIGIRHGEKLHETLLSREEHQISEDLGNYYRIPADNRDLNYDKFFIEGMSLKHKEEFNSYNTRRLEEKELIDLLGSIGYKK